MNVQSITLAGQLFSIANAQFAHERYIAQQRAEENATRAKQKAGFERAAQELLKEHRRKIMIALKTLGLAPASAVAESTGLSLYVSTSCLKGMVASGDVVKIRKRSTNHWRLK
jgi:ribosomal protein S25